MKSSVPAGLALCALLLAGCGMAKQKAADYYLGRARAAVSAQNLPQTEIEDAFRNIGKALAYAPASEAAISLAGELADAAVKSGFAGAQELEAGLLKKAIERNPLHWSAREALLNFMAERGDIGGLEAMAGQAGALEASGNSGTRYCALLLALAARASALPWLESEGYLSLNKNPDVFFEKTAAYSAAAEKIPAMKAELEKLAASDPGLKLAAPAALVSAAEVAAADALRSPAEISRIIAFNSRTAAEPEFRKAVAMTVQGNASLARKEYSQARAFYQGALNRYPRLVDARRQLVETDFQEGAAMAAAGEDQKAAAQLLYKAYAGAGVVIADASKTGNVMPFTRLEKFLGETYALKAADLAALRAVKGPGLKNPARLEAEFKGALDEALKLNPEGRLARELLERYTKEGF